MHRRNRIDRRVVWVAGKVGDRATVRFEGGNRSVVKVGRGVTGLDHVGESEDRGSTAGGVGDEAGRLRLGVDDDPE